MQAFQRPWKTGWSVSCARSNRWPLATVPEAGAARTLPGSPRPEGGHQAGISGVLDLARERGNNDERHDEASRGDTRGQVALCTSVSRWDRVPDLSQRATMAIEIRNRNGSER